MHACFSLVLFFTREINIQQHDKSKNKIKNGSFFHFFVVVGNFLYKKIPETFITNDVIKIKIEKRKDNKTLTFLSKDKAVPPPVLLE